VNRIFISLSLLSQNTANQLQLMKVQTLIETDCGPKRH
jgi:hypothetical protein